MCIHWQSCPLLTVFIVLFRGRVLPASARPQGNANSISKKIEGGSYHLRDPFFFIITILIFGSVDELVKPYLNKANRCCK